MDKYLRQTDVIDWGHAAIVDVAASLFVDGSQLETASACFRWVRDSISHSFDANERRVTCAASEVLEHRTGICYAKSHLLAAILRANHIPAGFGYQRLAVDDETFCLHGFNFVHLDDFGWYAVDPRGNHGAIQTRFEPPDVSLAFTTDLQGESTMDQMFPDPLECVVTSLRKSTSVSSLRKALPDWRGDA